MQRLSRRFRAFIVYFHLAAAGKPALALGLIAADYCVTGLFV